MKRLWFMLTGVMAASFAVLGWIGTRIYQEMPPIPDRVVTTEGRTVIEPGAIGEGQNVWQTMGGMEVGSVWGHGSYVAPDWTADCCTGSAPSCSTAGPKLSSKQSTTPCPSSGRRNSGGVWNG